DFDNDGLEDAFEDGWLFRRRDGGHLEPVLEQPATAVAFGDADHDGDLDLYVGREGPDLLLVNSGGRGFLPAEGLPPVEGRTVAAVWSDIDNDRDLDLVALRAGAPAALLYNERLGRWRAEELETGPGTSLWVGDADGDGWMDLQAGERRFRNVGGRFRLDTGPRGSPPAGRRLEIRLRGRRSNRDGLGARLTLAAGRWRATAELQRPGPLIFQVPGERPLDYLRVRWPSGVLQVETGLSLPGEVLLEELDRKGTSCPILYAHDGERWRFVTDFLGGSAVGHLLAPGVWNTPDPDEQVKVPGALLAARDGRLRVLAVNQLEEVIWFDRFALLAVPHEPASEVHPDERLAATVEGMPSPRILETRDATSLAAVDGAGLDCSDLVRECDGRWPDGFRLLPYKGYGELHHLELDLGRLSPEGRQFLFLDAWIDYSDSTSNLAAAQAGVTCVPPRLEVPDGRGGWRVALEDLGFPAGLTKTMTREVTGLWDPADPRLRIVTNLRIYWDRVRAGHALEVPPGRTRRARPVGARLFRLGYPRGYDANDCAPDELWARHAGTYTPLGDVLALLREADDRFVTTMNGDAIELTFTADALLAGIPEGHTVDFVLQTEGFGKDMDLNSAVPFTVDPLPFHGMTAYPPPLPAAPLEEAWAGRRVESLEEGLDWRRARQGGIR
ncbi:MAG: VCBS repeat-containing protein, partial [Planctomycetes bacterium]|nr:VCBS repeat-containing protein [Planctomycetota bacterium]